MKFTGAPLRSLSVPSGPFHHRSASLDFSLVNCRGHFILRHLAEQNDMSLKHSISIYPCHTHGTRTNRMSSDIRFLLGYTSVRVQVFIVPIVGLNVTTGTRGRICPALAKTSVRLGRCRCSEGLTTYVVTVTHLFQYPPVDTHHRWERSP